ncbi:unnamed protein product, partial [Mesorhabditis spiculigera]
MGITCMVNSTAYAPEELKNFYKNESIDHSHDVCKPIVDESVAKEDGYVGYLMWSPSMQSALFGAIFYGGLVTMAFSGYLADRYGPKMLLVAAVIDCVVFTMIGPTLAERSYPAFFASRAMMGIGIGCVQPCINSMASKWFPSYEKSTAGALYTTGNQLASSFTSFFVAELCASSLGWPSFFYFFGGVGLLWSVFWIIFVTNSPQDNRWTGEQEKEFLEREVLSRKQKDMLVRQGLPIRHLLFNRTMQAIYFCQFAFSLCAVIMQSFLPTYFKDHLFLPIHLNGLYNIAPFFTQIVSKKYCCYPGCGSIGVSVILFLLAWLPSCENPAVALYLLSAYGMFFAGAIPGFFTSLMTVAPQYSGTISSISTGYATVASLAGPNIIALIDYLDLPNKWLIVFGLCATIQFCAGCFFICFGQAKIQPWAQPKDSIDLTTAEK